MNVLILEGGADDFESYRLFEQFFQRGDVPVRRPEFQFRVARRPQAGEIVIVTRVEVDAVERLRV